MGLRNVPVPGTTETHTFMPPPATAVEEEKTFDEEPFKFPPMVKDDAARAETAIANTEATKATDGAAKTTGATNEAGGQTLTQVQDWRPAGNKLVDASEMHSGDKVAAVGRRQAVPKMDLGPISAELLPEVGIDFGPEAKDAKLASSAHDGNIQQASGRARISDAGSFEKNFEEYLRKKNAERTADKPVAEVVAVADVVEAEQAPKSLDHDMFSDRSIGQNGSNEQDISTELNGSTEQNGSNEQLRANDFPSLVHGVESNPAFKRLEEAREKIEIAQIKAFRETQGEFRGSIADSDKYLEDTFKSFNLIMNDGMAAKAADDARKELLTQHAGLQETLNGVPGEELREHLAMQSFDYLYGDATTEHREAILDILRRAGVPQFADGLKTFGETLERVGPALQQEAQVKGSLQRAFNESYSMRTMYGESIFHAMNHSSTPEAQRNADREEISKISEEQRSLLERFKSHFELSEIYLELRARKNPEGVIEAHLRDNRQIA